MLEVPGPKVPTRKVLARKVAARKVMVAVVAKVLLAVLLAVGALFPDVGGFAGKGMAFRLSLFLAPGLIVPLVWHRRGRRDPYPAELDLALTVPFLLDTIGNAVGAYDHWNPTDDVLHFVNWIVLIWGITAHLARHHDDRTLLRVAGAGIGAIAIIGWEIAEYGVMKAGVGNLSLTYADTLGDLALSTAGGTLGALIATRKL